MKKDILALFVIVLLVAVVINGTNIQSVDEYYLTHIDDITPDAAVLLKGGVAFAFLFPFRDRAHGVHDVVDAAYAQYGVHLRQFFKNLLPVAFRQASRDNDRLQMPVLFQPGDIQDIVNGFFFCTLNKRAGIDDDNVCVNVLRCDLISRLHDFMEHDLGVKLIFGATQRNKSDLHSTLPFPHNLSIYILSQKGIPCQEGMPFFNRKTGKNGYISSARGSLKPSPKTSLALVTIMNASGSVRLTALRRRG